MSYLASQLTFSRDAADQPVSYPASQLFFAGDAADADEIADPKPTLSHSTQRSVTSQGVFAAITNESVLMCASRFVHFLSIAYPPKEIDAYVEQEMVGLLI